MRKTTSNNEPSGLSITTAWLSLAASVAALLCLAGLHFLSPEFDPSWRVVSDFALGSYGWVLALMVTAWELSSWTLAFAQWPAMETNGGKAGLVLIGIAGLGEALASVFDLRSPALHGLAGALGIPTLPIAAILISVALSHSQVCSSARRVLLLTANLTWISFVLMVAAMLTLTRRIRGFRLPIGWPNRLLVAIYLAWAITVAWKRIRLRGKISRPIETSSLL